MRWDEGQMNPRKFLMINNPGRLPSFQDGTGRNTSTIVDGHKGNFIPFDTRISNSRIKKAKGIA
jgi:hypothetical protein